MAKINVEQAKARLKDALKRNDSKNESKKIRNFMDTDSTSASEDEIELVKIIDDSLFIFKNDDSYILSPADDKINPIIGEFDEIPEDGSVPPCFQDWLGSYVEEVDFIQQNEQTASDFDNCASNTIELVDLGLPSGTKWGNMNIGAENPEDNGDYYAWAELETKTNYTTAEYKYYDSSSKTYTKLENISKNAKYDISYKMNKEWCMPSLAQGRELLNECKWETVELNGKGVWKATGPNGKSIYFPFNGCKSESSKVGYIWNVYIWLSDEVSNGSQARTLKLLQSTTSIYNMYKRTGAAIRPVNSGEVIEEPTKMKLVDLGLPSGTKWANMNIGAENPEDSGDYYAWGEIEPKNSFTWANYKWNNSESTNYKSLDLGTNIAKNPLYDPAFLHNNSMCLPTATQWEELFNKCTLTYKQINGKNVYEVVGPNGNSIILSLGGYKNSGTTLVKENVHGCYMSSSIYSTNTNMYSKTADIEETKKVIGTTRKMVGRSIRPVSSEVKNTKKMINPLMPYKWSQTAPFNNLLPLDPATGKRVITGCTQTAMAQLIAYYGCIGINGKKFHRGLPPTSSFTTKSGTASKQVIPALPGIELIDYDNLNFYKPADFKTEESKKAVAELMRQLGYMNKAAYTSSSTTASVTGSMNNAKNILHLGNASLVYASSGIEDFKEKIYKELEQGYPVNVAGWSSNQVSGHSFICDGYNPTTDKFHFNWGWGGSYDGWFDLSLLNTSSFDYSYYKNAIIGLHPDYVLGDINNDDKITITDVMSIVQDIVDNKVYDYKKDINFDGKVDEEDVAALVDYILGKKKL